MTSAPGRGRGAAGQSSGAGDGGADGGGAARIHVKVVPGASRSRIVGRFGEGIRVQIAAPPERGKANAALCELLAEALGVRTADVEVVAGHASARKVVRVRSLGPDEVARRLPS